MTPIDLIAIPFELASLFGELPSGQAVVPPGSTSNRVDDGCSDFDIYVYTTEEVPVARRWRKSPAPT